MTNEELISNAENWKKLKKKIQREANVSEIAYNLWLENLEIKDIQDDTVYIMSNKEDERVLGYLDIKFKIYFETVISEALEKVVNVKFVLKNSVVDKKMEKRGGVRDDALNPEYTFESFVVGKNNIMAQQLSMGVAEAPGKRWNPLYIYGGSGLGKTHLMQAIGNFVLTKDPTKKVLYVTSEQFTNDVIEALRSGKSVEAMCRLREKYRTVDLLMIDDIQFIIGKEATQEEFFHTFNTLHASGKQIVLSSEKSFKDFKNLDDRYISRFAWGMTVDITPPDYETRSAILKNDVEKQNIKISEEIIDYIATNIKTNIRELEGALNKIIAFSMLHNNIEPDMEFATEALRDYIFPNGSQNVSFDRIVEVVCMECNVSKDAILSNRRSADIVYPRQIIMYLSYEMLGITYQKIADKLKKSDHTTIISGCRKIEEDIQTNKSGNNTRQIVENIKKILLGT